MRAGGVVTDTMANIRTTIDELNGQEELAGIASRLSEATDALAGVSYTHLTLPTSDLV